MKKERLMAIFIGVIMILSMIGFSLSNVKPANTNNDIEVPFIINGSLKNEDLVSILRSGRIVIEDFYQANCTTCPERSRTLETFFGKYKDYAVIQMMEENQTSLKIIGAGGKIKDITGLELSDSNLMKVFCETALAQPRECLLEQI
jgi:hypothetical protein